MTPEVVGATILLGAGIAARAGLEERIEHAPLVVVIEVPHQDWIEPMTRSARAVFAQAPARPDGAQHTALEPRPRPIVVGSPRGGGRPDDDGASRSARAFREHRTLIGITAGASSSLPSDLLLACEERLVVGNFDPELVELLLEHVVGSTPGGRLDRAAASAIEPVDLRIAVHPGRGADGALDRLSAVLEDRLKRRRSVDAPLLENLPGYGAAAEWGLAAAADLSAYARDALQWFECESAALLAGPPGSGKTSFAGALAAQAGVPLVTGSLAQWQSTGEAHLGTTLKAMREFFDEARKAAPCVALIDELDSFGDRRSFIDRDRHYWTMVVNGFLECLDAAAGRAGILLIGTTNDRDRIDSAILRSGRFERCFTIPLPSISDLVAILRHHLGPDLAAVDLTAAAGRAAGGTGADCAAWVRRARSRARRANREFLPSDLIAEIGGAQTPPSGADDRRAAVHEGGHAVVAHALGFECGTIAIHGAFRSGGMTETRLRDVYPTDEELHDLLAVCLAGRAAEILVLGRPSTGSEGDLVKATELSLRMHCSWGLKGSLAVRPKSMSSDVMSSVELDLRHASATATSILAERRGDLDRLAELLTERRALDDDDLTSLLGPAGRHRPSDGPNAEAAPGSARQRVGRDGNRRIRLWGTSVDLEGADR